MCLLQARQHSSGKIVDSVSNVMAMRLFSRHRYENNRIKQAMTDTVTKDRTMQYRMLSMHILWDVSIILLIGGMLLSLVVMYGRGLATLGDFSFITSVSASMFFNFLGFS